MRSLEMHIALYAEPGPFGLVFPAVEGGPMRRSNFRRRVWEPATAAADVSGLRFHDLRHTGATLAAASGATLRTLMARLGHSSANAALRYQHVLAGQDAKIARYLERFGELPRNDRPTPVVPPIDRDVPRVVGTQRARPLRMQQQKGKHTPSDQRFFGGDDGTRTHDPLVANQVLFQLSYVPAALDGTRRVDSADQLAQMLDRH